MDSSTSATVNLKKLPISSFRQPEITFNSGKLFGNPPARWTVKSVVNRNSAIHFSLIIQQLPKGSYQIRVWGELFTTSGPQLDDLLMGLQQKPKESLKSEIILVPECREFKMLLSNKSQLSDIGEYNHVRIWIQAEKQELIGEATKGYQSVFTPLQIDNFTFEVPPAFWLSDKNVSKRKKPDDTISERSCGKRQSIAPNRTGFDLSSDDNSSNSNFVKRVQNLTRIRDYERMVYTQEYFDELKNAFEQVHKKYKETERNHAHMDRDQFRSILNHDQMVLTTLTQGVSACHHMANLAQALNPPFYTELVERDNHWALLDQLRQIADKLLK